MTDQGLVANLDQLVRAGWTVELETGMRGNELRSWATLRNWETGERVRIRSVQGSAAMALAAAMKAGNLLQEPSSTSGEALMWQPIDTAPKSGYLIGAWKEGKWHAREIWWDDSVEEWTDTMSDRYLKPTHWTPTPDSASGEGQS